ncbi:hypothetical protein QTP88_014446 [Uroleucon formosanum]
MNSNSGFLHKNIEIENDDSAQDNESSNDEEESQFGDKNKVVNNLASILNIFYLALKIACTLPVSSTSPERTFSKLKILKNRLRTTISQDRLEDLMIMTCESDIEIINEDVVRLPYDLFKMSESKSEIVMGMTSEYLNYLNIRISKFGFESNSYPDLRICFLCDLRLTIIFNSSVTYARHCGNLISRKVHISILFLFNLILKKWKNKLKKIRNRKSEFKVLKKCGNTRYLYTNKNCSASLLVDKDVTKILSMLNEHTHGVIPKNIVGRQIVSSRLKRKCENDLLTRPNKIIRQELRNTEKDIQPLYSDIKLWKNIKQQNVNKSRKEQEENIIFIIDT